MANQVQNHIFVLRRPDDQDMRCDTGFPFTLSATVIVVGRKWFMPMRFRRVQVVYAMRCRTHSLISSSCSFSPTGAISSALSVLVATVQAAA